jgi:hypothetical protein
MKSNEGLDFSDFDISNTFLPEVVEELEEVLEEEEDDKEVASEETPIEEEDDVEEVEEEEDEDEVIEESTVDDDEEEVEDEVDLNLTPLMELVNRDMPVELDLSKYDSSDEESLAAFIRDAVKENSKPEFASDEVREFNDFVANGGDPRLFIDKMYGQTDYESVKLEDNEAAQKEVLRDFLIAEYPNRDANWIEAKIERYENSGVLAEEANDALSTLVLKQEGEKDSLAERQRLANEERLADYNRQITELEDNINKQDVILGKPLTKTDKKNLFDFATKRDKYGKTGFERASESAPNAALKILFLAYNNFDEGAITKVAKTKAKSELKKNLTRYSSTNASGSSGSSKAPKSSNFNLKEEFGV